MFVFIDLLDESLTEHEYKDVKNELLSAIYPQQRYV